MTASSPASFLATRRGRRTLLLLCPVQFLDVADSSIMNIALPSIRRDLGCSVQNLQWVLSGYLVAYEGCCSAAGPVTCSGGGGCWPRAPHCSQPARWPAAWPRTRGMLIGARIGQGAGAALMATAGLSILTTTSSQSTDRSLALGAWGAISAIFLVAAALIALRATDTRGEPPAHPGHSPASHDGIRVAGLTEARIRVTAPGAWPDTRPQTTPAKPPHPGLTRA